MGIGTGDVRVGPKTLTIQDLVLLVVGETLVYSKGYRDSILVAEVTVEEVILDEDRCQVKVCKIKKQGLNNKVHEGDTIDAIPNDLSKP